MTRTCTCKTLALVAGGVAMIAASAAGEGSGLQTSSTVGKSSVQRGDEVKVPAQQANFVGSRTGGTAGDICANATTVACGGTLTTDNTKTSGGWDDIDLNDPDQNFCIGNAAAPLRATYWYKFVATDTSAVVHFCNSLATDSSVQAYSGTCAGLTEIGCAEDNCGASTFNGWMYLEGLTIGNTYYVQQGTWDGDPGSAGYSAGSYTIEIVCPGADCATCTGGAFIDNDGPCSDIDFQQNGNPADTPSVPAGNNNNYGCVWPDTGVGPGGTENDPDRIQSLGTIVNAQVCGSTFLSQRSDAPATTYFRDYDWYDFEAPVDAGNGPQESLTYDFYANTQKGFFILQNGADNLRGCVQLPPGVDDDVYFAAFGYYPLSGANGGVGDCNVHNTNTIVLDDGETFNMVIRTTRDFDGAKECSTAVAGHNYTVLLNFGPPPTGACCETDDTCSDNVEQFNCFGIYRGNNSVCATLPVGSECPTALPCPSGGLIENAGAGEVIGANDTINVGCNADPDPITGQVIPIAPDLIDCGNPSTLTWCGTMGNFMGNTRDLDWYRLTLPADAEVTMTLQCQIPSVAFLVETFDGNNFAECEGETTIEAQGSTTKDSTITINATLCAGDYYVITAVNSFTDYQIKPNVPSDLGWEYVMTVSCSPVLLEVGACCLKDATCIETDPCDCGDLDGLYYGQGTTCADANVICCLTKCDGSETPEAEMANLAGDNCEDFYFDLYNGGCGARENDDWFTGDYYYTGTAVPTGTVPADPFLDTMLDQIWCGRIGEYLVNLRFDDGTTWSNEQVRDLDYYRIQHTGGNLLATMCPDQFTGQVFLVEEKTPVGPTAIICDTVRAADLAPDAAARQTQTLSNLTADPCTVELMDFGAQVAGQYYLVCTSINTVFGNDFNCAQGKTYTFSWGDTSCSPCTNVDGSPDGVCNLADLNLVLFNFGQAVAPGTNGDTNCDGACDLADLNAVLFDFGNNVGC
ncbi:MAG: hypothetical protein KDA20_04620 [Phycisphaerales bacterium]|nr:hypothetical protein [Phycisphaerales bacterium]